MYGVRRFIEDELDKWSRLNAPKPLILRGARQVGKTYVVEKFARKNFTEFININFEASPSIKNYFDEDLDPLLIIQKLELRFKTKIDKSNTLIFFDEIQACPRAIQALRFFYEKIPGLRIIAAGSLLEFALRSGAISIPVGRVQYMYLQPLSFMEFLSASDNQQCLEYIEQISLPKGIDEDIHEIILAEFKKYMFLGGMPAIVRTYLDTGSLLDCVQEQSDIINACRDDFSKYAKERQLRYLDMVLDNVPRLLGKKFKYAKIDPDIKSLYLKEALWLLNKSSLVNIVKATSGEALPLGAMASDKNFKVILLDSGLAYRMLDLDELILEKSNIHNLASGGLAEQVVGQELIAYQKSHSRPELFYWERNGKEASAKVDFLYQHRGNIYGIEVKAGKTGKLESLYQYMKKYKSDLGIKISQDNLNLDKGILSVPLYAINRIDDLISGLTNT
jgi:predicted AAA+ superfamily ATPase